jgi:2-dehydro-3-deoxyphosphooctonate aldolase (KDO 8-P synthase)
MLTERGTFFGYNRLVNDLTAIPRMQRFAPVVYDATHSCQQPGGQGTQSGGSREFLETMSAAAIAAGADAIFAEVHDNPAQAKSDSATQMPLDQFEGFVRRCLRVRDAIHG